MDSMNTNTSWFTPAAVGIAAVALLAGPATNGLGPDKFCTDFVGLNFLDCAKGIGQPAHR